MIIGIIWVLVGVILLGVYNGLLLLDDKTTEQTDQDKKIEREWHLVGAFLFVYLAATAGYFWGIKLVLFTIASFWLIYSGLVHIIGMKKSWFYVGNFAWTDKTFRKIFHKNTELWNAIIKITIWIATIVYIIL